jgi:hypothetical protein
MSEDTTDQVIVCPESSVLLQRWRAIPGWGSSTLDGLLQTIADTVAGQRYSRARLAIVLISAAETFLADADLLPSTKEMVMGSVPELFEATGGAGAEPPEDSSLRTTPRR